MQNMIMMFGLFVPMAHLGSELYGLKGIFISGALSFIIIGIASRIIVIKILHKVKQEI